MFKVNNKNTRTTSLTPFSSVSIADFEQVNVSWDHYNLRHHSQFTISAVGTVFHGSESISFVGPNVWKKPDKFKNINSLEAFKSTIKSWKLDL